MADEKVSNPSVLIWYVPAAMLVLAVAPLPYSYFMVLRLFVFAAAVFAVYHNQNRSGFGSWVCTFLAIAVIFNPIFPVHLTKIIWVPIDLVAAGCFVANFRMVFGNKEIKS
jgi:hypothetical protein